MKPFTTILLCGASALAGGIAGYIFHKKRVEEEINQRVNDAVNEELARIRKDRQEKQGHTSLEEIADSYIESGGKHIIKKDESLYAKARQAIEEEFPDVDLNESRVNALAQCLVNCQKMGFTEEKTDVAIRKLLAETEYPDEDDDAEWVDEAQPNLVMSEYQNKPPAIISVKDYSELPPYFEFLTFHYFEGDDVLIDDEECIVDDIDGIVGDALVHFGECDENDDDTVYVVNGNMGLAIEIERIHSAYSEWNG